MSNYNHPNEDHFNDKLIQDRSVYGNNFLNSNERIIGQPVVGQQGNNQYAQSNYPLFGGSTNNNVQPTDGKMMNRGYYPYESTSIGPGFNQQEVSPYKNRNRFISQNSSVNNGSSNQNNVLNGNYNPSAQMYANEHPPSFTTNKANEEVSQEDMYEKVGLDIQRCISAPGAIEFSTNNMFAYGSKFSHLFGDIRYEPDYNDFYETHKNQRNLPPPLASDPFNSSYGIAGVEKLIKDDGDELNQRNFNSSPGLIRPQARVSNGNIFDSGSSLLNNFNGLSISNDTNQNFNGIDSNDLNNGSFLSESSEALTEPDFSKTRKKNKKNTATPVAIPADSKLKELKRGGGKFLSVKDFEGKIYTLSKDQHGCRFLQKKLEDGDKEDLNMIFEEVFDHIVELMTDPFGNYLCQKLVDHCDEEQKTQIIGTVSLALVKISMNMHGTRAVQKLIECLKEPEQKQIIIKSLSNSVVPLIKDLNGNHVIQRCLQKLKYSEKQFIYDSVAGRCVEVSTHKHGCCVLQRCIDYASFDQKMLLVNEVIAHALYLVQNPYGNYVVQYVLDLNMPDVNNQVIMKFLGSLRTLSQNKFSSNVIEKCLKISYPKTRQLMIDEVASMECLPYVIRDSFGNYVVQTALTISDQNQFVQLSDAIKPLLHTIRNTPYCKKIESKLVSVGKQKLGLGNMNINSTHSTTNTSGYMNSNSRRRINGGRM